MKEYTRTFPEFSLCGLACGLCPRYHTDGKSKCPGCGGQGFHMQHPSCAVITCSRKHDDVEYCSRCTEFPCARYAEESERDSFITYRNRMSDFKLLEEIGEGDFRGLLEEKISILQRLLRDYNDGRRKSFYCVAVNLLPLQDLQGIMERIDAARTQAEGDRRQRIESLVSLLNAHADTRGISLKLRR